MFTRRNVITGALVFLLLYVMTVPILWPAPTATATLPATARLDQDAPVQVELAACHSNVDLVEVRVYVDYTGCTATTDKPLYPVYLLQVPGRERWPRWNINRVTWPWRRHVTLQLPLRQLHADGLLQPGSLHGKIDVTLVYPSINRYNRSPDGYWARTVSYHSPFAMTVSAP